MQSVLLKMPNIDTANGEFWLLLSSLLIFGLCSLLQIMPGI